MNAVWVGRSKRLVVWCVLGTLATHGIYVDADPVETALTDVRETCAGFFATDSTVFGNAATPAEFSVIETALRPGPRGNLPVAIDFSREQAEALARDYRHATLLGKERWYAPSIPLGITGIRAQNTLACDVFPVLDVAEDSPASGKVLANDVIIGANGRLFDPGGDPRVPMGYALAESETEALGGILTLQLVRDGVPMNVPIEIGVLGEWSATLPYNCKKSRILADRAVDCMLECFSPNSNLATKYTEGSWWSVLMLMGSGNDEALDRARRAAHGIAAAYAEAPDLGKKHHSWGTGYDLLILAEYYLLTGDSHVLSSIEHAARILEHGQSRIGSWGHYSPVDGYGDVNQIGNVCFLGLVLARECGIEMDPVALPRSTRFFGQFAGGVVPYGNGAPGMFGGSDNGRNCELAVAFHILGADDLAARFVRPVCYSYLGREGGHACSVFGPSWGPLGAALAPAPEFHMFMNNLIWYYELARSPEGGFYYLASQQFPSLGAGTGVLGLGLMLPRKQLRILGAPKGVFGTRPPEPLRQAAGLYRDKKWQELKGVLKSYLGKPGAEHADYAKGLLAACERQEKHTAAVMYLIRANLKKGHASVVAAQVASLTTLLGQTCRKSRPCISSTGMPRS